MRSRSIWYAVRIGSGSSARSRSGLSRDRAANLLRSSSRSSVRRRTSGWDRAVQSKASEDNLSVRGCIAQRSLRGGEARHRNTAGCATDVVHAHLMAERHGRGITALFATDADLERCPLLAPTLDPHADELANSFAVDRLEGVVRQHTLLEIFSQELALGIVARIAVGGLGQVVGSVREELGGLGDLAGNQAGARDFHAGAEFEGDLTAFGRKD